MRLKGQGMPNYKNPQMRGDLYVTIYVDVPSSLTAEQQELAEQLKASGL